MELSLQSDLFEDLPRGNAEVVGLGDGAALMPGLALSREAGMLHEIRRIAAASPFRRMVTPGGHMMSVAMTNCGEVGWVTDRRGYRYEPQDPVTGGAWPRMPDMFADFAKDAAAKLGFANFRPDCCLVNRYQPDAKMSLHRDTDEADAFQPIVSVSLGVPAVFLWGGLARAERPRRIGLASGDVVAWGGPARFVYHGIAPLAHGHHDLTGTLRFNLTFRTAR
jgi:alkylated DNA repair protein (DNA oxidative demethylase)